MPKAKVRKGVVKRTNPVASLRKNVQKEFPDCLICWEPLTDSKKVPGRVTRFQSVFDKLCSLLSVDLSNSTWDFSTEAFPFCLPCFKEIEALVRLQEKLLAIQSEIEDGIEKVRNQLSESDHRFVSTDLRIIQFRSQALGDPGAIRNDECVDDFGLDVEVDYDDQTNTGNLSAEEDEECEDDLGMVDDDNDEDYEPSHSTSPIKQHISKREIPNLTTSTTKSRKRKSSPQVEESKEIVSKKLRPCKSRGKIRKAKNKDNVQLSRSEKEYLSPCTTTKDGTMFYENIEIAKNDIGYVCGLCGWMCKVQGHSNVTLRKTKIHINGAHLDAYNCKICNAHFLSKDTIRSHTRAVHEAEKIPCDICLKPISGRSQQMDAHKWTHKNAEEKATARALDLVPTLVIQRRLLQKEENKRYKCHKCYKSFIKPSELAKHLDWHTVQEKNGQVKCPICSKVLYYKNSVTEHMKTHGQNVTMIPEHSCPNCNKKYFFRVALDDHMQRVHCPIEEKQFECTICNWRFKLEKDFQFHSKNHKPIEYYTVQCDFCDLRLKDLAALAVHKRQLHKDKLIESPRNKTVKIDINEIRKKLIDSGVKQPWRYSFDGSLKFDSTTMEPFDAKMEDGKLYFKGFEVSKQGDMFSCVTCGSEFKYDPETRCRSEKAVKHHIILDHLGGYACTYCDQKLQTHIALNKHKYHNHFHIDKICEVCGKVLNTRKYKPHLWTHKSQEDMAAAINKGERIPNHLKRLKVSLSRKVEERIRFKCGDCPKAFSSINALDDHRLEFKCHNKLNTIHRTKAIGKTEEGSRLNRRKQDLSSISSTILNSEPEYDEVSDNTVLQSQIRTRGLESTDANIPIKAKDPTVGPVSTLSTSTPTKSKNEDDDVIVVYTNLTGKSSSSKMVRSVKSKDQEDIHSDTDTVSDLGSSNVKRFTKRSVELESNIEGSKVESQARPDLDSASNPGNGTMS